jgi:hypothetical protein
MTCGFGLGHKGLDSRSPSHSYGNDLCLRIVSFQDLSVQFLRLRGEQGCSSLHSLDFCYLSFSMVHLLIATRIRWAEEKLS